MGKADSGEEEKRTRAEREEMTLAFWKEKRVFEESLRLREGSKPFVFYDGPPFATGAPHYGHLLQSAIKDVIPRYQTMKGRYVRRVWGWDCHGLPVENLIEGELGLKHKKDIEAYGVEAFNEKARGSVLRYDEEWKKVVPRMGRWIDMDHSYKTMDAEYTESVWWAFKTLYGKRLVYEGYKSMHLCPRCETTLSNFEVAQGYKDVKDISVYVKFPVVGEESTFFLAWTTTPWTLPGNAALAVGMDMEYVALTLNGDSKKEIFILSRARYEALQERFPHAQIVKTYKGGDLAGREYVPVFDAYKKDPTLKNHERGWKVYVADFVTAEEGTGIVHIAPAFGEDDMKLGERERLPFIQHVGMNGVISDDVEELKGREVKPKGEDRDRLGTDIEVVRYLQVEGLLFAKENITHPYPHCWRCDTPLLNYAANSWFVKTTAMKEKLIEENKKIGWVPEHIRDGRFGNWLENVRDWAISRSRYWGAPIPVWRCGDCKDVTVVGSLAELRANMSHRNTYTLMRHGEAESNAKNIISGKKKDPHHLTANGKKEVEKSAKELKGKQFDLIYASPFVRTRETAEIVAGILGYNPKKILVDDRLSEIGSGVFDGGPIDAYRKYYNVVEEKFTKRPEKGEHLGDVKKRVMSFLDEIDRKHEGKNILIVTHEYDIWMLVAGVYGLSPKEAIEEKEKRGEDFFPTGGFEEIHYAPLPHNEAWEIDYHRPYIDAVKLHCRCGGEMVRVLEVFDCWFESGSMPYAQFRYLGNNATPAGQLFAQNFPADFIAEAVDQTRGWFYNMHVLSVGLFERSAFRHAICTGLILAEDGQKMSKKLKNYPDVMEVINKYGADALRLYMLSSPVVRGENLNFSLTGLEELYKKVILRTENVMSFYDLYGLTEEKITRPESTHILDRWILARIAELYERVEQGLDRFELDVAVRDIPLFVDDLSTWYLRRSRERMKGDDEKDKLCAQETLRYVLLRFAQVIAPIMPFFAEDLYTKVKGKDHPESVHFTLWPTEGTPEKTILETMAETRSIVSLALEARAKAGIKVRQPLQALTIGNALSEELQEILQDEVNVKEIHVELGLSGVRLDLTITPELLHEGYLRDLVRAIQEKRKDMALHPADEVTVNLSGEGTDVQEFLDGLPSGWEKAIRARTITRSSGESKNTVTLGKMVVNFSVTLL